MNALLRILFLGVLLMSSVPLLAQVQVNIQFPLGRKAYQTNERIDLAIVRSDGQALPASSLVLTVNGDDGSKLTCTFPVPAVPVENNVARATEHLYLNGWLLRPGHYALSATVNGAMGAAEMTVYSHVRKSTFKLIDWGSRAQNDALALLGEDGMGFNLIYGDYRFGRHLASEEGTLKGGADFMQCCTMSGAHQMDLRSECDWSDPLVVRGGTARAAQQAFINRTAPNTLGVHFYDEPGLTWWAHAKTGKMTPHNIPTQDRSFKGAFGKDPIQYFEVKPENPDAVAQWMFWGRWKESFMEAAWKDARFGVEQVDRNFISATQSVYGFSAYADGYYFNVVRSLPVISGHGGYNDGPASYFYPSYHHEMGRMRDLNKPNWYLPSWYGGMTSENYRLEQYLSFMTNLQGMAKPPDMQVHDPFKTSDAEGIVEANKLMARLGTIFTAMPITRGEVALLYSMSQNLDAQIKSGMEDNYEGGGQTRAKLLQAYLAGKMLHIPFFPVVEEDVLDGTLAANHKALILAGTNYLEPKVIAALEAFIASGGTVLVTDDSKVQITGATKVGAVADETQYKLINDLWAKDQKESMRQRAAWRFLKAAEPLAQALKAKLAAIGIRPELECNNPNVVITRQSQGDIDYYFAVNAAGDEAANDPQAIKPTTATIIFPDGPLYDAGRGGVLAEKLEILKSQPPQLMGTFRLGAGQVRVFAHTARPIGGVQVMTPTLFRDYTVGQEPIHVTIAASLVDTQNRVLAGAAPLQIRVTDPLGVVRYDLYRATDQGTCKLTLPLAANDPAGAWTIEVRELLANTTPATATFTYKPVAQCGALAGAAPRAVSFGNDRENIYRFFRTHQDVTLVKGTSPYLNDAAGRLAESLKPWGVRCTIVNAADVNKAREINDDDAKTWVGLEFGRVDANSRNHPEKLGFALNGPAVLLGTPADNPLIATVGKLGFLPYVAGADYPGRGRGYLAWQRDAIGIGQESITLIAGDAAGISEAVGTLYEIVAGLDPLMKWNTPDIAAVTAATAAAAPTAEATTRWRVLLPDRAVSLQATTTEITATSLDGSRTVIGIDGKVTSQQAIDDAALKAATVVPAAPAVPEALQGKLAAMRVAKRIEVNGALTAVGYWGGQLQIFANGTLKTQQMLPGDVSGLAWAGDTLIVAVSDGAVIALQAE